MDVLIPIVFPDYLIAVNIAKRDVDLVPFFDFDNFTIPGSKNKVPELGHAGVLFINGSDGTTKYYEYGRYDPPANLGLVRRIRIPDVIMDGERPTERSLGITLNAIARRSGQGGRISGVYIEVEGKYAAMLKYAETRKKENTDPGRKPYSLLANSCLHFVKDVAGAAGVETPWMIDPRPNSYIGEFRDSYPKLDFDSKTGTNVLKISNLDF